MYVYVAYLTFFWSLFQTIFLLLLLLLLSLHPFFFKILLIYSKLGKERKTLICCSTYWCIHWFILVCALTGDRTHNLGIAGLHSNQLSNLDMAKLSFIEMNLLGWHWIIKLYKFQVYNSIIHHLYVALCVYHPKSSLLSLPFILP